MRTSAITASLLALLAGLASATHASDSMPWAFNAPAAEGYSITLEKMEPTPGTTLIGGSQVTIIASIAYTLSVADHGVVVLVPQDERNRAVASDGKQVSQAVSGPSGSLVLEQTLTVPRHAKEIRVFIPLVPDGISNTTGEITVRYPVVEK